MHIDTDDSGDVPAESPPQGTQRAERPGAAANASTTGASPSGGGMEWVKQALSIESFWFGLAALVLAFRGQRILTPGQDAALQPDFNAAKRWYVLAIGLMLFGWWNSYTNRSLLAPGPGGDWKVRAALAQRAHAVRVGIAASAVVLNLVAIAILHHDWYSFIGGWLWAISMLVLVLAFIGECPTRAAADVDPAEKDTGWHRPRWAEIAVVLAILAVAFTIRVWRLGDLSPGMHGDEGEAGTIALDILRGVPTSPFGRGWFTHSNIYFWSIALCMKVFGTGLVGLRSWAVICGLVTVLFIYLITREMFGMRAAIIAGFFLAFQSADVLMSRQESSNAATPMYTAVAFFCLVRGLKTRRHIYFALAGIAAGFNVYYFAGGRLVAPTIIAFLVYLAVVHRAFLRAYLTHALTFMAGAGVTVTPFLFYNRDYPLAPNAYPNDRFIWLHEADLSALYGTTDWRTIVWDQLQRTLSVITWSFDLSANHILDYPIARPLEAVLIVLGLAWAAWRWRDSRFMLLSAWFWSSVIAGGVLTVEAPNVPRLVGMLPALPILMAAWLDHFGLQLQESLRRLSRPTWRPASPWISGAALGSVVLISGIQNWDKYVNYYLNTHTQPDVTEQALYVQHAGPGYQYYDLGAPDIYFWHGDNRFINAGTHGVDFLNPAGSLPITDNGTRGETDVNFMVWGPMYDYLPVLRAYYPGGREEVHPFGNPGDTKPLITYIVTHQQIDRHRVVHARYLPLARGAAAITRTEESIGTDRATPPLGLRYPARATWSGGLVAPLYGVYRLGLAAPSGSVLMLDGKRVPKSAGAGTPPAGLMTLAQGVHSVRLSATLRNAHTPVRLQWAPVTSRMGPIQRRFLWDNHVGRSWNATITPLLPPGTLVKTLVVSRRIDGFLGFRATQVGVGEGAPFKGRWTGNLHVKFGGLYGFETNSNGTSVVKVDGKVVVNNPGDGNPHVLAGSVDLRRGMHRIVVDYTWQTGVGYLEMWWTPPGGKRQLFITPSLQAPP